MFVLYRIKVIQVLIIFGICIFVGFRGVDVGTDTINYLGIFENICTEGYQGYPEPLYGLSCLLASYLGISYNWHQVLLCFFAMLMSYVAILRSPNVGMSIFLLLTFGFICYTMNIYGQLIACYISLFAFSLLSGQQENYKFHYILCILFAMGFHMSAAFLLPLIFVDKFKLNGYVIFYGITISLVLGVIDVTSVLSSYLMDYARHLNRSVDDSRLIKGVFLSLYWTLFFLLLYRSSDMKLKNGVELRIFFVGILLYNVFLSKDLALRFLLYFLIPMTIWVPTYLTLSRDKIRLRRLFVILYSSLYYFVVLFLNTGDLVPYYIFD